VKEVEKDEIDRVLKSVVLTTELRAKKSPYNTKEFLRNFTSYQMKTLVLLSKFVSFPVDAIRSHWYFIFFLSSAANILGIIFEF
jgi:hypothetical protein